MAGWSSLMICPYCLCCFDDYWASVLLCMHMITLSNSQEMAPPSTRPKIQAVPSVVALALHEPLLPPCLPLENEVLQRDEEHAQETRCTYETGEDTQGRWNVYLYNITKLYTEARNRLSLMANLLHTQSTYKERDHAYWVHTASCIMHELVLLGLWQRLRLVPHAPKPLNIPIE